MNVNDVDKENVNASNKSVAIDTNENHDNAKNITKHGVKAFGEDRNLWKTLMSWPSGIKYIINRDKSDFVWTNIVILSLMQIIGLYALFFLVPKAYFKTLVYATAMHFWCGLSITAGMHRLYSHKSYKATLPLRLFWVIGATLAYENSVFTWARDHRVHHKYSETDADPHDSRRGLFFAHMGWLMVKKTDELKKMKDVVDVSDLLEDKLVVFQHTYYKFLLFSMTALVVYLPTQLWNETLLISFGTQVLRIITTHHFTWFINSIAHWEGEYSYDDTIWPVESLLPAVFSMGEGWHNFHHRFPNDYRASDYKSVLSRPIVNLTWFVLDLCIFCGLAFQPFQVSDGLIRRIANKSGRK